MVSSAQRLRESVVRRGRGRQVGGNFRVSGPRDLARAPKSCAPPFASKYIAEVIPRLEGAVGPILAKSRRSSDGAETSRLLGDWQDFAGARYIGRTCDSAPILPTPPYPGLSGHAFIRTMYTPGRPPPFPIKCAGVSCGAAIRTRAPSRPNGIGRCIPSYAPPPCSARRRRLLRTLRGVPGRSVTATFRIRRGVAP